MVTDDNRIRFVISNFDNLEKQLLECMEFMPFIDQNKHVVSSKFIPIIGLMRPLCLSFSLGRFSVVLNYYLVVDIHFPSDTP